MFAGEECTYVTLNTPVATSPTEASIGNGQQAWPNTFVHKEGISRVFSCSNQTKKNIGRFVDCQNQRELGKGLGKGGGSLAKLHRTLDKVPICSVHFFSGK